MRHPAKKTTNHDMIRRWVEERGGHPARVKSTERGTADVGLLRIDFPGHGRAEDLEEISWEEFFGTFEQEELAFLYQDVTTDGEASRFNKLVSRQGE